MKKGNTTIIASIFAISLVTMILGMGTMAYFYEIETVGITFAAGDPNLRLSLDGTTWGDSLTYSFPLWAPGDTCDITVYLKNNGDIGLENLFVTGDNLGGPNPNLAGWIIVSKVGYSDRKPGGGKMMVYPAGGTYYDGVFGNKNPPLRLTELANGLTNGEKMNFCWGTSGVHGDYLLANSGRVVEFYIEFTFDSNAGNTWQGKSCSFDLVFRGTDEPGTFVWYPAP